MRKAPLFSLFVLLAPLAAACSAGSDAPSTTGSGGDGASSAGGGTSTSTSDGSGGGTGGSTPGADPCGNGLDDDQNGQVDDGCSCTPGDEQPCFLGDPALAGVGPCGFGTQACVADANSELGLGQWTACLGSGAPSAETCDDSVDNDCNGETDEGCICSAPTVTVDGLDLPLACGVSTATATLTFDQSVTGVVAGDTVTISAGATIDSIAGGPAVYTVALSGLDAAGPYTLDVLPVGASAHIAATCGADLAAPATKEIEGSPATAPTVSVFVPGVGCGAAAAQATLTFSGPVTGVAANDTVIASGGAVITSVQGGPTVYSVDLASLAPGGSYGLTVLPVGASSTIESAACHVQLDAAASASFEESTLDVALSIAPGPVYTFGEVLMGNTAEQTFTVTPSGGGLVSGVAPSIDAPFKWKGGAYPGAGGTCGMTISAPCTVVVTYAPASLCTDFGNLTIGYETCNGSTSASAMLAGHGTSGGPPTPCPTSQVLYVSPGGSDASSGAAPNLAKKTLGAALAASVEGTEIRAAEGVYGETLNVSGCRKLFGGYDPTFQVRDPAAHVSAIVASAPNAGVVSFPGASLHLDGFTVQNTAETGEALYYFQGGSVISHNILSGADYGMYFWQHSCGAIYGNVASGAQGGMYFWQSRIPVYENRLTGTNAACTTWQNQGLVFANNDLEGGSNGIQTWQEQGMIFDGNRISGGSSGVNGWQSTGVVYRNNYLYGGSVALGESSGLVVVANNTMASPGTALSIMANDYVVTNNVFLGTGGGATGIQGTMPSSIENNLFLGLATLAQVSGHPAVSMLAGLSALDQTSLPNLPSGCTPDLDCWTARVAGNVSSALLPGAIFTSPAGPDASIASLTDDDWHLLTNDPAIVQGGKDASQGDCGSHEAPRSCGDVDIDVEGLPRTMPYSIGAHEK